VEVAPAAPALPKLPDVLAVVDGSDITRVTVEEQISRALGQQGLPLEAIPANERMRLYRMVVEDAINQRLIEKRSDSFPVADADVDRELAGLKTRFGTEEALITQLKQAGQTLDTLKADIRAFLRKRGWMEKQLEGKPVATEAEAKEFFEKNPQQFEQPAEVQASHILFRLTDESSPEEVITKDKASKAVLERIKKGEDFTKLADEFSEDPSAKQNHGSSSRTASSKCSETKAFSTTTAPLDATFTVPTRTYANQTNESSLHRRYRHHLRHPRQYRCAWCRVG
jgi:parvulin-like peptidyl-prolyl isomerase